MQFQNFASLSLRKSIQGHAKIKKSLKINMKIIFFGTPAFAVKSLKSLAENKKIEILSVITQPDKPAGRKNTLTPPSVKIEAEHLGLTVNQPKTKKELSTLLNGIKADFFVVIAYGMILPKEILKMPKYGTINVHASLLPKYRGASPIQESLLMGDKETGISIMLIDEELDHGPIIMIKKINIEENDDLNTLSEKLSNLSSQILPLALEDIMDGIFSPIPQDESKATYCQKIKKTDGKIDWNKEAHEIKNMIRAYKIWPSVYFEINDKKIKIIETDTEKSDKNIEPGKFLIKDKILKISTKNGFLIPKILQIEGKKEMDIKSFLNGYSHLFSISQESDKKPK